MVRTALLVVVVAGVISISLAIVGATVGSREANIGQTITRGDVSITLDALRTSNEGTKFTYS